VPLNLHMGFGKSGRLLITGAVLCNQSVSHCLIYYNGLNNKYYESINRKIA